MKRYKYKVTTAHQFPIDMLRYDTAWPASSTAASLIEESIRDSGAGSPKGGRVIEICSQQEPTAGRWRSFLCRVTDVEEVR